MCNHLGLQLKYIKIQTCEYRCNTTCNPPEPLWQKRYRCQFTSTSIGTGRSWTLTCAHQRLMLLEVPQESWGFFFHLVSPLQSREEHQPSRLREPEGRSVSFPSAGQRQSAAERRVTSIPSSLVSSHLLHPFIPHPPFSASPAASHSFDSPPSAESTGQYREGSEAEATAARNWTSNSRRRREQKSRREGGKRERAREAARHGETTSCFTERGGFKPPSNRRTSEIQQQTASSR